jgi:AcrR family transcriptional regulator
MTASLSLLLVQGALGAFDTLWYHEWQARLPSRRLAGRELLLHALRDFAYAVVFGSLAWLHWRGALVWLLVAVLAAEIVITLWDFIEEDLRRPLPPGERVMHTIMGIVYGAFLARLAPELAAWMMEPTGFAAVSYGWLSWLMSAFAAGVFLSGIRDLAASLRREPAGA